MHALANGTRCRPPHWPSRGAPSWSLLLAGGTRVDKGRVSGSTVGYKAGSTELSSSCERPFHQRRQPSQTSRWTGTASATARPREVRHRSAALGRLRESHPAPRHLTGAAPCPGPRSGWSLGGEEAAQAASGCGQFLQLDGAAHRLHWLSSSFLTGVAFFSSLSTAHFTSASLHHRSVCNANWETRGSFSFGLVYGRIPRGIQNVLTQINGTNKSKISLAT